MRREKSILKRETQLELFLHYDSSIGMQSLINHSSDETFNVPIVSTVTLYSPKASKCFKTLLQFSYLFNRNALFAWYVAAALKPLPLFPLVHANNGLIVRLFLFTKTNPKAPRYYSY